MKIKSWLLISAFAGFFTAGQAQKDGKKSLPPSASETKNVNRKFQVPSPPPKVEKEDITPPPPAKIKEEHIAPPPPPLKK